MITYKYYILRKLMYTVSDIFYYVNTRHGMFMLETSTLKHRCIHFEMYRFGLYETISVIRAKYPYIHNPATSSRKRGDLAFDRTCFVIVDDEANYVSDDNIYMNALNETDGIVANMMCG